MGKPVIYLKDSCAPEVEAACHDPAPGSVIHLEIIRYQVEGEGKGADKDMNEIKAGKAATAQIRAFARQAG